MGAQIDLESNKFKINPYVLALFFGGLLVFTIGMGLIFFKPQSEPDVRIISSAQVAGEKATSEILVHVDGAVLRPGVYRLGADSRVDAAINVAGGMASDADTSKVNLAAKLVDGQKVYIAFQNQNSTFPGGNSNFKIQNSGSEADASLLISINSASAEELDKLPGIGPVTAQKIISNRPYGGVEELLSKKSVSNSVYLKIKDLVAL